MSDIGTPTTEDPPAAPPRSGAALTVSPGFTETERQQAATVYWEAFRGKLGKLMGPDETALAFLADVLDPGFALVARDDAGQFMGLAGYKTDAGSLVGGQIGDMRRHYGWFGTAWRAVALGLLERKPRPGELLMDGICVASAARGRGAGTALLHAIKSHAISTGAGAVRLDVIDTNPRARALYEREGFTPGPTVQIGPLRHLFGFTASTEMTWTPEHPLDEPRQKMGVTAPLSRT